MRASSTLLSSDQNHGCMVAWLNRKLNTALKGVTIKIYLTPDYSE